MTLFGNRGPYRTHKWDSASCVLLPPVLQDNVICDKTGRGQQWADVTTFAQVPIPKLLLLASRLNLMLNNTLFDVSTT